ncbi:zinc finger protein 609 isoform X4 [Oryzias latipes]
MSCRSSPPGGKSVDSSAVDTYDSGDEWDIGVGNLIIDLEADLEKDKLEMSINKEGGAAAAPSGAVAALPNNIKFVSPSAAMHCKDGKSRSKRVKSSKDGSKFLVSDGAKREVQGRAPVDPPPQSPTSLLTKGGDKSSKNSRTLPTVKKEVVCGKSKKDKTETTAAKAVKAEEESGAAAPPLGTPHNSQFAGQQNLELGADEQFGHVVLDSACLGPAVAITVEQYDDDSRSMKPGNSCEKMDSPVSTSAPPPLHLLGPLTNSNDISSACEQIMVRTRSVAVNTAETALATEPDCLGPCEPGTSVNLEGIVWQETEDGMLVVNVTWRNKTYVGTLLDCTRHDWAPPRFCDSPTSDMEMRGGRGRGKRMRSGSNVPSNESSSTFDSKGSKTRSAAASSKGKRSSQAASSTDDAKASPSSAKRRTKPVSDVEPTSSSEDSKVSKRMRTSPAGGKTDPQFPPQLEQSCPSPVLIDCPHPNCNKKYKHINGLKYHQAHAHNDLDVRLDQDGDSEYGEDPVLHPDLGSCGTSGLSPASCITPKGRGFDAPLPSLRLSKVKKTAGEPESQGTDGGEEEACLTDEASNDGVDDRKARKLAGSGKTEKVTQRAGKLGRPGTHTSPGPTSMYSLQSSPPAVGSVVQCVPSSPQSKTSQPKAASLADTVALSKDKKKRDKKKKDGWREEDGPYAVNKAAKSEEAKGLYSETSEALLNGCVEVQQSRLASMKAEADKVYSFSDSAPSPSLGMTGRVEPGLVPPLHLNQNGGDNLSVKTSSPAYSDISDVGEDGEGKADGIKIKQEPDQGPHEGAKKALFSPQGPRKESHFYPSYDSYYSPNYPSRSPGVAPAPPPHGEDTQVKVKKEEDLDVREEAKLKVEPPEESKVEMGNQQPSVIQQRSNLYSHPLYYNQYYVPPYSYPPDPAYHAQLLASNPAYRQQYEDRQRQADRKGEGRDQEVSVKEEWKQKALVPPTQSNPSLTDLGAKMGLSSSKAKDAAAASDQAKSAITPKGEDPKVPAAQGEGIKVKPNEARYHGTEEVKPGVEVGRPAAVDPAMWYRQEADSRLWSYVYPSKYSEALKAQEEDRWKEERERRGREERQRPNDGVQKEAGKEGADGRAQPLPEEHQDRGREMRFPHMQFPSALPQHQAYMPYLQGPYAYSQGYEPSHPGFRGMPSVVMQNYPDAYLPAGYAFSYGGKAAVGEDGEKSSRSSPALKPSSEAKALDLLQQHASQYKSKSPSTQDQKNPHERERDAARPRSSPSQRLLPPHHHVGYPLLSGQYDLSYSAGLSSSAIVAGQQTSSPSMYPPARRSPPI